MIRDQSEDSFAPWAKHLIVINTLLVVVNSSINFVIYCGDAVFRECVSALSRAARNVCGGGNNNGTSGKKKKGSSGGAEGVVESGNEVGGGVTCVVHEGGCVCVFPFSAWLPFCLLCPLMRERTFTASRAGSRCFAGKSSKRGEIPSLRNIPGHDKRRRNYT